MARLKKGDVITIKNDDFRDDPIWRVEGENDSGEYHLTRLNPKLLKDFTFMNITRLDQKIKSGIVEIVLRS